MLLMRYSCLPYSNMGIIYSESILMYSYSIIGVNKLKLDKLFYLNIYGAIIALYQFTIPNNLSNNFISQQLIYLRFLINEFFNSILNCYLTRFRINGRGYRMYVDTNNLLLKLGYSHNVYNLLPLNLYIPRKEKQDYFWKIYGGSLNIITQLNYKIKLLKLPNVYTLKGIIRANDILEKKQGKKAYSL